MSMAQKLKKYVIGAVIGFLIGLAVGVNIGKGQPVFSNPFAQRSLGGEIKDKAKDAISETKKALREKLQD